jgi:hypothetical protein
MVFSLMYKNIQSFQLPNGVKPCRGLTHRRGKDNLDKASNTDILENGDYNGPETVTWNLRTGDTLKGH